MLTCLQGGFEPPCRTSLGYGVAQDAAVLSTFQDTFRLPLELPDPLARDVQLVAEFGEGSRLAVVETVAPNEHVARPLWETFDRLLQMHGNADGTAFIRHRALYCLPYPPRGVRREPEAPVRIELLDGLHQADVALLDQVLEGQPVAPILFGHRYHEPEVLLDKP